MAEVPRLILMLLLAGGLLTLAGAVAARFNDEPHRIRRGLKKVLKTDPHALIVARGRGRGAGFNFTSRMMAVAWDVGGWCLLYTIDELIGAELVLDGQVTARAWRGEARRALDLLGGAEKEVRLRLVFDDARHPDFDLVLWTAADAERRGGPRADDAIQEANRWISRTEALLRRPQAVRPAPPPAAPAPAPVAAAPPPLPADEPPPWEDEPEDAPDVAASEEPADPDDPDENERVA